MYSRRVERLNLSNILKKKFGQNLVLINLFHIFALPTKRDKEDMTTPRTHYLRIGKVEDGKVVMKCKVITFKEAEEITKLKRQQK